MRSQDSPFPAGWWGMGLEKAGLGDPRPWVGTYGRYPFERLPPTPSNLCGDFAWLRAAVGHESHIGQAAADAIAPAIAALQRSAASTCRELPPSFIEFLSDPALHARIRSSTDCYLDVCPALTPAPVAGHLVRFLADSQGCLFWYLYLPPKEHDHAVVASSEFFGTPKEEHSWRDRRPNVEIVFAAESFEGFLWRLWTEEEIWHALYHDESAVSPAGRAYIEAYLSCRRAGP